MESGRRKIIILLLSLAAGIVQAQDSTRYRTMVRIYEDNDFMNVWGNGTDKGYTNGTRLDIFYNKKGPSRFFIDRWMPKAGDSSINTFGWGIMQTMITPYDIHRRVPDNNDYPYSGALFAVHSLHASNPKKKYNVQTEWMIGVIGPPSLAKETQTFMHRLIAYQKPMGWAYQLPTDLILNLNLSTEKLLAHVNKGIELIGGAQVFGGTALNGAALYSLIRFGKMRPYFNGLLSQYTGDHRRQFYFIFKPAVEWMLSNALLEGGVFTQAKKDEQETRNGELPAAGRRRIVGKLDYGVVLASGRLSLSFTQSTATQLIKGLNGQSIGNVSLYVAW
jgi:lipid A 3-O-deacylase